MTSSTTANDTGKVSPSAGDGGPARSTESDPPAGPVHFPPTEASTTDPAAALLGLRRFHRGQSVAGESDVPTDLLPALLHPLRGATGVRTDYPLYLAPAGETVGGRSLLPLPELLEAALASFTPGNAEARILRDNLLRLERMVRDEVPPGPNPVAAAPILAKATSRLREELGLRDENALLLEGDLRSLLAALPEGGELLGFHSGASLPLLLHAAREHRADRLGLFRREVETVSGQLRRILDVERAKDPGSREPEALGGTLGGAADRFVDATTLSGALGHRRGSETMAPRRRRHLEELLEILDAHLESPGTVTLVLLHDGAAAMGDLPDDVRVEAADDPLATAVTRWREEADRIVPVVRAMRKAALEAEDRYEPARHDPWFEGMGHALFTSDEIATVPVVAVQTRASGAAAQLASFSTALLSGAPLQILLDDPPIADPGTVGGPALSDARLELGYLGIGHRGAFTQQSSAARPGHLVGGFLAALTSGRCSLHLLAGALEEAAAPSPLGAWLETGAALEGRAHPFFRYDPTAGATWAARLDFGGNPSPETDWPIGSLEVDGTDALELAFTFADYALLSPSLRGHFRVDPGVGESDDLLPLAEYLELPAGEAIHRVPFVWATSADGRLTRLVLSESLVSACRDRRGWWRTLQELAGVRNEYVLEAVEKSRAEMEKAWEDQRRMLTEAHAAEIERVRGEATAEALAGVARSLLDLDVTDALRPTSPTGASTTARPVEAPGDGSAGADVAEEAPPTESAEEEDDELLGDAWVDTPLCTSCNDCVVVNPKIFVYDANKQVRIGDATAGTFEQVVVSAEKCPAHCIHPGAPRNPGEPNLDALVERAKPFQ